MAISLLGLAALLVGVSKTALPGAATVAVAVFAAVLPAKQSTGALLVLLILGDLFAVWTYHAHADWATLRRMVPTVIGGILVGTLFLAAATDATVRRVIGVILLVLIAVTLTLRTAVTRNRDRPRFGAAERTDGATRLGWQRQLETGTYGVLAGFTTMVANSGGPVMSMYFLALLS
jgi:uncharacterized membrane protein YfcA